MSRRRKQMEDGEEGVGVRKGVRKEAPGVPRLRCRALHWLTRRGPVL